MNMAEWGKLDLEHIQFLATTGAGKAKSTEKGEYSRWQPEWFVTTERGSQMGIARDDHCLVVLSPDEDGQWRSIKHIPSAAAQLIGKLVSEGVLNY